MAGALTKRDIEMIFRAETDKATRPIGDLKKEVTGLRQALAQQIEMAEKGEVSLDNLATSTKNLKKAQDELGSARSLLTSLNNQVNALERAEQKTKDAGEKFEALKAQVDGAEKPTKRLSNAMDAAGRAAEAAAEKEQRITLEVAKTREQIEAIIGPVTNFQASFRTIAETSKEAARGLAISGEAVDQFKAKLAGLDAAEKAQAGNAAFQQQGKDAGLLQAQIDYISQFENRVELLNQAKRELTQQNAAFDHALEAQSAQQGAANVARITAAFQEAAVAEERLESVNAFRGLAAEAQAAATNTARFGSTFDSTAASATRLAQAVAGIVDPVNTANRTIGGLEETVRTQAAVLDGGKKSATEYQAAFNGLAQANAAAQAQARDVDAYRVQEAALASSTARFRDAQAEVQRLATALATTEAPTAEMARDLKTAEAALATVGKEMQRDATLAGQLGAKLKSAGHDTSDLTAAENRLTVAAKQSAAAQGEIAGKLKGTTNAFGLSLQSAQNLGFQVNDIITQLSLGQGIFRTLASQGGQIIQDPGITALIGRYAAFIPIIAGVAAVFGTLYAAMSRVTSLNESIQQNAAYLATLGDAGNISAEQLSKSAQSLTDLGVSAKDAQKAVRDFALAGLDPAALDSFTTAAKNASDVTGVEFPAAAELLTAALSGGYDQAAALDDQFHFLTDSERVQIRAMYDSGKEAEAREMIFDRFYSKMGEGADKMNGPWKNAIINLSGAWRSFLDWLGNQKVIQNTIREINDAIVGMNYLLLLVRGFSSKEAGNAAVNGQGRAPTAPRAPGSPINQKSNTSSAGQQAIQDARRELDVRKRLTTQERLRNAEIEARRKAPAGATPAERAELASLARTKEQNALNAEAATRNAKAARSGAAAARRAQNEAEALQNKIDAAQESLHGALDRMNAQVARTATGSLTDQLSNAVKAVDDQFAKLYRQLEDFRKLAGAKATIDGQTQAQYRAQLDANKQILSNQAQLGVYETNLNALLNQRKSLLAGIEEQVQSGILNPAQAVAAVSEVTSRLNPLIADLSQTGINFAQSIAGTDPSPQLQAFMTKLQAVQVEARNAGAGGTAATASTAALNAGEVQLNKILAERNSLVTATAALVEIGLKSHVDAQHEIAAAYKQTQQPILDQVAAIRAGVEAQRAQGLMNDTVYNAWIAKLQAVSAQAQYTDANVLALNNLVQTQLVQGGTEVFSSLAKGIADFATGAAGLGDVFSNVLDAFLNFAANFLQKIAEMIIQALILQAIQSALGLPGGGGGLGGLIFGSVKHGGGKIGDLGSQRKRAFNLSPAALSAIPRYHEGTQGVGLKPNERLGVLEVGEKVLTEEQQRREAASNDNAGGAGGIRQLLVLGDDEVAGAMAGPSGERTVLTHLRRNKTTVKQLLKD